MSAGVVPTHKGRESSAAYGSTVLHPRAVRTGRYAMTDKPYEWRAMKPLYRDPVLARVSRNR